MEIQRLISGTFLHNYSISFNIIKILYLVFSIIYGVVFLYIADEYFYLYLIF